MRVFLFFLLFSINCLGVPLAQEDTLAPQKEIIYDESSREPLPFDANFIEELKQDEDFQYVEVEEVDNWWTQFKTWLGKVWRGFWHWLLGDLEAGSFLAFILEILPYLLLIGIFAFIVWLFIRLDIGASLMGKPAKAEVFLSEEERIIQSQDINALIQKALEEKNYRLAVRYYYLLILKNLSDKEEIVFQAEKTNEDYLKEIKNKNWQSQFKLLTRIYDFIWYGSFEINELDYFKAEKHFKNMQLELQKETNE